MKHFHTFVIPAYGASPYLETCVRSLLAQTEPTSVLITTATDNAHIRAVADKYGIPVKVNPDGGSIGKDWNYALRAANTQFVTLAHQDDVYDKHYVEKVVTALEEDPLAVIAFCDYHEIRDGRVVPDNLNLKIKKMLLTPLRLSERAQTRRAALSFGNAISCPSVSYNTFLLDDFSFDESLGSNLDWKAWADLAESGDRFAYVPEGLVMHRIHAGSETTKQIKDDARTDEDLSVLRRYWPEPVARLIGRAYKRSEKRNTVKKQ